MKWSRSKKLISRGGLVAAIPLLVILSMRLFCEPLEKHYSSSQAVYDRNHELLRLTLSDDQKYRLWVPLDQMSPALIEASLIKEDRHFYQHFGVNPYSIARAVGATYLKGGRRIGGSTITMQLARMIYGIQSKSISGKVLQMVKATELELFYSKKQILEAYLNLIPLGANIEGVGAASLIYFHRAPSKISIPEALSLIEIPQNPNVRGFSHSKNFKLNPNVIARWNKTHSDHPLNERDAALAVQGFQISDLSFKAPHLAEKVLRLKRNQVQIHSTIDSKIQSLAERQIKSYIENVKHKGIKNASALLVDYRTMEVRALVGSADYFDDEMSGQINGTEAKRSPGSALKPFVYGLAMDQGLIHPQTMLKDAPTSFGSFDPENFDREYIGPIAARDALIRSRNIPAVSLFSQLKGYSLYQLLQDAEVTRMRSEKYYGYALPLGGSEVTMEELVQLYGSLANGGEFEAVHYFEPEKKPTLTLPVRKRLMTEDAAYLVYDMLTSNPRPDQTYSNAWVKGSFPVAWKTGTSHGFRDAWSVGIFGPYVLAVWLGNFDGAANPNLIGRDAAGPLFFKIVDALRSEDRAIAEFPGPIKPPGVARVKVCALSGQIPGKHCHDQINTLYLPGKSPIKVCDIHRSFKVNPENGLRVCDREQRPNLREEVYEVWPSEILKLFRKAGLARKLPPAYEKGCAMNAHENAGRAPLITSPKGEMTYVYRFGDRAPSSEQDTLSLTANTDGDVESLHWFINNEYLGKAARDKPLFWKMRVGHFQVRTVDDQGRSDSKQFSVEVSE